MSSNVTITMTAMEAERFTYALSDILCWCSGFEAGRDKNLGTEGPLGTSAARDLNIKIKYALNAYYENVNGMEKN